MTTFEDMDTPGAVEDPKPDEVAAARRTTARHATSAEDLTTLLSMLGLGLIDDTPVCGCGAVISRIGAGGYAQHPADGMCRACTQRTRAVR